MPALVVVVVVSGVVKKPKVTRAGGTPRLCGCCLGMGGEGRLLLAWHAVRWWGRAGGAVLVMGSGGVGRTTLGPASRSLGIRVSQPLVTDAPGGAEGEAPDTSTGSSAPPPRRHRRRRRHHRTARSPSGHHCCLPSPSPAAAASSPVTALHGTRMHHPARAGTSRPLPTSPGLDFRLPTYIGRRSPSCLHKSAQTQPHRT